MWIQGHLLEICLLPSEKAFWVGCVEKVDLQTKRKSIFHNHIIILFDYCGMWIQAQCLSVLIVCWSFLKKFFMLVCLFLYLFIYVFAATLRRGLTGGWIQASVTVDPALKGISALIIWSTKPLEDDDDVMNIWVWWYFWWWLKCIDHLVHKIPERWWWWLRYVDYMVHKSLEPEKRLNDEGWWQTWRGERQGCLRWSMRRPIVQTDLENKFLISGSLKC